MALADQCPTHDLYYLHATHFPHTPEKKIILKMSLCLLKRWIFQDKYSHIESITVSVGSNLVSGNMAKCTKKVGIVGKYGTHYGTSLRKMGRKLKSASTPSTLASSVKTKVKRRAVGIWHCVSCMNTVAGGAWTYSTTSAVLVLSAIRRLTEMKDQ